MVHPLKEGAGHQPHMPVVMTIAGSDSGGGAGIQVDLKTFTALGCMGTTAITAVTAQNPESVKGVTLIPPDMVALQIKTVSEVFAISAVKTGMLPSPAIVETVAETMADCGIATLVVDPVMVATSGSRLIADDAADALRSHLIPKATVVTPNIHEAEMLCGHAVASLEDLEVAARDISKQFGTACVVTGGHVTHGDDVTDVLWHRGSAHAFSEPRVATIDTHGTGCTFSAALTALLAKGESLVDAVEQAKSFVTRVLLAHKH